MSFIPSADDVNVTDSLVDFQELMPGKRPRFIYRVGGAGIKVEALVHQDLHWSVQAVAFNADGAWSTNENVPMNIDRRLGSIVRSKHVNETITEALTWLKSEEPRRLKLLVESFSPDEHIVFDALLQGATAHTLNRVGHRTSIQVGDLIVEERRVLTALTIANNLPEPEPQANPRRRARANPSESYPKDLPQAVDAYTMFQALEPKKIGTFRNLVIPSHIQRVGQAVQVRYSSRKWENKVNHYYHDHEAGVRLYAPDADGPNTAVPAYIREARALALLGKCQGYTFNPEEGGEDVKIQFSPMPELYTTPNKKALLVIDVSGNSAVLVALAWGGGLIVEDRGIVG